MCLEPTGAAILVLRRMKSTQAEPVAQAWRSAKETNMKRITTALVANLLVAAAASANFGPQYVPKDRKVAEPPVSLMGVENHTDYVFYLRYHLAYRDDTLIEVKDNKAFKLDFKAKDRIASMDSMALLAMRRKDFDKRKQEGPSLKWLSNKTDGLLEASLTPLETTERVAVKEIPVTTYRVTIRDGKLIAEKVESKKSGAADSSSLVPPWTIGIACSISMAWLGIWFSRRATASSAKP
jgi:hypothetical protein